LVTNFFYIQFNDYRKEINEKKNTKYWLQTFSIYNSTIIEKKSMKRILNIGYKLFLYTIQRLYIEKKSTKGLLNSAYNLFYIQFNDYI